MNRFGLLEDFFAKTDFALLNSILNAFSPKFHLSAWINLLFDSEHNSKPKLA